MARSILSFGMFSALAAIIAARKRGLKAGSDMPSLADTVISRASFENSLERALSARPFLCMMFLNCEWPAMGFLKREMGGYIERPSGKINSVGVIPRRPALPVR